MAKKKENISTSKDINLTELVVKGMEEMKGADITVLDLRDLNSAVADMFVICSGNSDTHVDSLAQSVEDEVLKATGNHAWRKEGRRNCEWVVLDYVDVVVHIFKKEIRQFYSLEDLWGDAKIKKVEKKVEEKAKVTRAKALAAAESAALAEKPKAKKATPAKATATKAATKATTATKTKKATTATKATTTKPVKVAKEKTATTKVAKPKTATTKSKKSE